MRFRALLNGKLKRIQNIKEKGTLHNNRKCSLSPIKNNPSFLKHITLFQEYPHSEKIQ